MLPLQVRNWLEDLRVVSAAAAIGTFMTTSDSASLLLLWLPLARAWVPSAVTYNDDGHTLAELKASNGAINRVWDLPATAGASVRGLGSGISYAWDPTLCDQLLPTFGEDISGMSFITCDNLRAAWARALTTWSVHHPQISFTDVSKACDAAGDTTGGEVDGEGCSLAQMWVAAKHNTSGADVAASAVQSYRWTTTFRHTDGRPATSGVYATTGSVIGFNIDPPMCWYLDSLFCSQFHSLKERFGSDVVFLFGQVMLWGLWTLAMLSTLWVMWGLFGKHIMVIKMNLEGSVLEELRKLAELVDEEGRAEMREELAQDAMELLDNVSKISILWTTLRLLFVWAPPVFYLYIFLPCWECFDFEAAAAHEVGHALGLMHPDQAAELGLNLAWNSTLSGLSNASDVPACDEAWADVVQANETAPSIMTAFTQFNKDVCLTKDDLDALNTLYPPACIYRVLEPQCYKAESYIGLVRLALFVGVPVMILMFIIVLCHAGVTQWETGRREKQRLQHEEAMSSMEREMIKYRQKNREHVRKGLRGAIKKAAVAPAGGERNSRGLADVAAQARARQPTTSRSRSFGLHLQRGASRRMGRGASFSPARPAKAARYAKPEAARSRCDPSEGGNEPQGAAVHPPPPPPSSQPRLTAASRTVAEHQAASEEARPGEA